MHFKNEETNIQVAVSNHIKYNHPKTLFTISPSGMKLPPWIAKMFKAMGYRAGTPDLLIFEPRGVYHGLLVELKKEDGSLQSNQREFLKEASDRGYKSICCYGYQVAIIEIDEYLKQRTTK